MKTVYLLFAVFVLAASQQVCAGNDKPKECVAEAGAAVANDSREQPILSYAARLMILLGHFHVVAIHFPIALLVVATVAEGLVMVRGPAQLTFAMRYCLVIGSIGAVVAACLGWVYAMEVSASSTLTLHRWLGTGAAVVAVVATALTLRDAHRGKRSWLSFGLLAVAAGLVGLAGHFGGIMTHGDDFLNF